MAYMSTNHAIIQAGDSSVEIVDTGTGYATIKVDGTEVARFESGGNFGIGTTNPDAPLHIKDTTTGDNVIIESTDDGALSAPNLVLYRNSVSVATDDLLGNIEFRGRNAANSGDLNWASIVAIAEDSTGSGEDGKLAFKVLRQGSEIEYFSIGGIAGEREVVINGTGSNTDTRIESNNDANMITVDGGNNKVGIGIAANSINATLDVKDGGTFRSTRLLTASVSASTTLTETAHAGRYNICAGDVTLPSTSTAGEHYAILNTTGGDITIGRNGNNINGAGSDATLATFKAATCIAIGSNNWMVVG